MASFGSFLGTALGTDPQAFQRGAENQLKLQALQRAEQDRLNLKNYAPNQMNLGVQLRDQPNLDSSQFGSDQLFIEPPKKVEPEVVKPIEVPKIETEGADANDGFEESIVGDDQTVIDNQETNTPETLVLPNFDADAESDMSKIGVSKTPDITQIDANESKFLQSIDRLLANGDFQGIMSSIQTRIATGYGDMLAGSPAGRAWGWFTDSPDEAAKRADSKAALDWFQSDEARRYFEQNPNELTGASVDPIGFHKTFIADAPARKNIKINKESAEKANTLIANTLNSVQEGLSTATSIDVMEMSDLLGLDKFMALSVLGIESNFGRNLSDAGAGAQGAMQVMPGTFDQMKAWYTNPTNIKKYNIPANIVDIAKRLNPKSAQMQTMAGLMYLKYGEYIGVPKNLLAAGYQGGMETVKKNLQPSSANDGNLTNVDYNRAVIEVYNSMVAQFGPVVKQDNVETANLTTDNKVAGVVTDDTKTNTAQIIEKSTDATADRNTNLLDGKIGDANRSAGLNTDQMIEGFITNDIEKAKAKEFFADEAKSDNTTNTAKATDNVSSLEVVGTETVTSDDSNITNGDVEKEGEVNSPAVYIENPSKVGFDMQQAQKTREEAVRAFNLVNRQVADYQRLAEIYRVSGSMDKYFEYKSLAEQAYSNVLASRDAVTKLDNSMVYLQGMQGLNDLRFGNNTNRLSQVWSMYSGRDVRVVPRSDGLFNITMDGETISEGVSQRDVGHLAQLQFDSSYRETVKAAASERSSKLFDQSLDVNMEQVKMINELTIEKFKARAANMLETLKQIGAEFKAIGDGSGKGIVQKGGEIYLFDPMMEYTKPNSDEKEYRPGLKKLSMGEATALLSGNAYAEGDAVKEVLEQ